MENISEQIYRIPIPLPFPLKYINAYAVKGENGWTIIDTGLNTIQSQEVWQDFLKKHNGNWQDIEKIILTHYHPDHYGLAGWLQEKSSAPVYISKLDFETAHLFWHTDNDMGYTLKEFYFRHGMPEDLANKMVIHMHEFIPLVTPKPNPTFIDDGDTIIIGDDIYQVITTPGHSDGHLCFYQAEKKLLFSGDHVLPKITPNVSLWPVNTDRNPLESFINSLRKINMLEIDLVYPAHKNIFSNLNARVNELINHHQERLDKIIKWVEKEKTAFQVCEKMFGNNLSIHQLRFAMAETLAHLAFLESEKKIEKQQQANIIVWRDINR